jgi:hypothetical protein
VGVGPRCRRHIVWRQRIVWRQHQEDRALRLRLRRLRGGSWARLGSAVVVVVGDGGQRRVDQATQPVEFRHEDWPSRACAAELGRTLRRAGNAPSSSVA